MNVIAKLEAIEPVIYRLISVIVLIILGLKVFIIELKSLIKLLE